MRIAVIGAGWAGLAAAVEATRAGHHVTLFEAARIAGGRARALPPAAGATGSSAASATADSPAPLDNGQHILIGAYTETLRLMRSVGVEEAAVLRRLPLSLRFADGSGIALPRLPAPWDVLGGILGAQGWSWRDKTSLLGTALRWKAAGFACDLRMTVAELCHRITPRVMAELIEPLCVSALNTPIDEASALVFLRVLKDALFAVKGGGDLLLPLTDLGALFPVPALDWLARRGAALQLGQRVTALQPADNPQGMKTAAWLVDDQCFDRVILACPPRDTARLVAAALPNDSMAQHWCEAAVALRHVPIATIYALTTTRLPAPMLCLRSNPEDGPAQFVFDRSQLGGPAGLLAFVASASTTDRQWLEAAVVRQAQRQLGITVEPLHTVIEKRATFACTPNLIRPKMRVAKGLMACGDYIEGPYPATIEGAVRCGVTAALAIDALDVPE
jgi:squalene-associated FAD-dependent desaturase